MADPRLRKIWPPLDLHSHTQQWAHVAKSSALVRTYFQFPFSAAPREPHRASSARTQYRRKYEVLAPRSYSVAWCSSVSCWLHMRLDPLTGLESESNHTTVDRTVILPKAGNRHNVMALRCSQPDLWPKFVVFRCQDSQPYTSYSV